MYLTAYNNLQTADEVEKNHWECLESEWEREKQKLLNALVSGQEALELPSQVEKMLYETHDQLPLHFFQDITTADYTLSQARSSMSQNELLYAKQIETYNKNTLNRILDNDLVKRLETAGSQMNDTVSLKILYLLLVLLNVVEH